MGWIALVGPEYEENLSLRYLASSLTASGYRSEIIRFGSERDFPDVLRAILLAPEPPLIVGVSLAFQWRAMEMMALAVALREGGYAGHITVGGHFATFACSELLRDFPDLDSVCRHESEETLVELAQALERGAPLQEVPGLALRDANDEVSLTAFREPPDLHSLPPPDRRGPPRRCFGHPLAPVISSRGCYAKCSFCCIAAWHEQTLPGKRYRLRRAGDVADEMVAMQRARGVEIFVFQDDNFFVPGRKHNLDKLNALADALERRRIGRFGVIVKARPNDVDPEVFTTLRDRLHALRIYVGVETDSDQGLITLARRLDSAQNHRAIDTLRALGLNASFNMLIFDPDTTLRSFERNVAFMDKHADFSFNFCRTELYAGTPLLARMLAEGRTRGDYFGYNYTLRTPEVQRVFETSIKAFAPRNFGRGALHNDIGGWHLQLRACRHFH
ncbi:MAG: B12-binding domain-containing radical SAM protein, partial [Myxococcales bacterium]|nr:B12-binding domain-containing radical SAM protein [Myxococcales bacterium]